MELINSEKNINEVVKEYNIARSTVNKWVKDYSSSGSFKAKDNRSDEENELIRYAVGVNKDKYIVYKGFV